MSGKYTLSRLFLAGLFFVSTGVFAKVAIVDVNRILQVAPQAVKAKKKLVSEFNPRKKRIAKMTKTLRAKEARISREGVTMSRPQLIKLERDIRRDKRKIKRAVLHMREDYTIRRSEELSKLQKLVGAAIRKVAKREKYDVVYASHTVIYYSKAVDITKKVMAALGKK